MIGRPGIYKTPSELRSMVRPGVITVEALNAVRAGTRVGVTTLELDAIAEAVIRGAGAEPNFMLVPGYRHTLCTSVNDEVVHGIPGSRVLQPGDIVSIDCGAQFEGGTETRRSRSCSRMPTTSNSSPSARTCRA